MEILITANSPGEIAALLKPVAREIKKKSPSASIAVALLPCLFASGREADVVREMEWVDEVYPARKYFSLLNGPKPKKETILLHLGGDLMYAAQLAGKWGISAWAYVWARRNRDRFFNGYFVRHEKDEERLKKQGIPLDKIIRVGDLVVDSVHGSLSEKQAPSVHGKGLRVCFMPGSRLREVASLGPFFLEVASRIEEVLPGSEFHMLLSPFLNKEDVLRVLSGSPDRKLGGLKGEVLREEGLFRSAGGVDLHLVSEFQYDFLSRADLAIAIPGTKTGEAGCLGIPILTILPLNRVDEVPFFGLIGLLDLIPFVGKSLKGALLLKFIVPRFGFMAQPNILAGHEIVPEMLRFMTPGDVAGKALELLQDETLRKRISQELLALYAPHRGAAERLVERMLM